MQANDPRQGRMAASSERIAVLVDARRLALRCQQLDRERQAEAQRGAELETQQNERLAGAERSEALAAFGERELKRLTDETRSRLRALADATGEESRLDAFNTLIQSGDHRPDEIVRWHHRAHEEVRALLPSQPASRVDVRLARSGLNQLDWTAYRMRSACKPLPAIKLT